MRIHSDTLLMGDLYDAVRAHGMTGVYMLTLDQHGSRKRKRAFEVKLEGSSPYATNPGTAKWVDRGQDRPRAATWDEWGIFIQALFEKDASAIIGDYHDDATFAYRTFGRFETLQHADQCRVHRWKWEPERAYSECSKCGAKTRWA